MGGKKGRISAQDVETYVNNNPNFILSEMGEHFGMSLLVHYWLCKLSPMWKQTKKSEMPSKKS